MAFVEYAIYPHWGDLPNAQPLASFDHSRKDTKIHMPTATQRLLQAHPYCCFCGGTVAAASLDHQPARIMFPDRLRPKGLEFPACGTCNVQTSPDEALVAFFARTVGNHRFPQGRPDKGLKGAIQAIHRTFPGLLRQITHRVWHNRSGVLRRVLAINGNNQQVETSVCRVAAKLALATYYDHHGVPAPTTVKINTMWTHNQNPQAAPGVAGLLAQLPASKHLSQGAKWDTQDTFSCGTLLIRAPFLQSPSCMKA